LSVTQNRPNPPDDPSNDRSVSLDDARRESAAADSSDAATGVDDSLSEQQRLQAALDEAHDAALRAKAELENFRRRKDREMQDYRRYSNSELMRALLPVLDNLNRAIEAAEQGSSADDLLEGVKMVDAAFADVLRRHHCERIDAVGRPFDPNVHEAVSQQPSAQHAPGSVLLETQVGYQLHDRVLRPSQVIVAAPPDAANEKES
jgi:molecular chaperone GrpE